MTKLMNQLTKENIRSTMNLVFTQMKFLSMLLELAPDNLTARETIIATTDSLFQQTAVMCHDINMYVQTVSAEGFSDSRVEVEGR